MRIKWKIGLLSFLCLFLFFGCLIEEKPQKPAEISDTVFNLENEKILRIIKDSITRTELLEHLEFLTSDRLGGRPTRGNNGGMSIETILATDYLKERCNNLGLYPAGEKQSPNQCVRDGTSINIAFYIPGTELSKEFLVLIAHYDHLGQSSKGIYRGANDNASGISALLELAQAFSDLCKKGIKPKRSIIFLFAGAEETGLDGSGAYAKNFPFKGKIAAAISLDMVGRSENLNSFDLFAYYSPEGMSRRIPEIFAYIQKWKNAFGFYTTNFPEGDEFGRSDQYSFWKNSPVPIPCILITSGEDKDYHTIRDTLENINFDYLERLSEFMTILVWEIANGPRPNFVEKIN